MDCPAYNSPQEIENVFAALGSCAPHLDRVRLVCCPVPLLAISSSNASLSVDNIRPLFSCALLKEFHLWAPHSVPLKDDDVVEMGNSWPAMCSLVICPTPVVRRDLGASFSILPSFAKNFPNLRELGLFFCKGAPEFDGDLHPEYQFTKLETLAVGLSPVRRGEAQDIGFLLASLCQRSPVIEPGTTGNHRGDGITEEEMADLVASCSEVRFQMNLAFRIKNSAARRIRIAGSAAGFGREAL